MHNLIVIPALAAHRPVVELSSARLAECVPDAQILIVTPNKESFADLASDRVRIEPDDKFAPVAKSDLATWLAPAKRHLPGWYFQQILKYSVIAALPATRTLVVDADTVILRDVNCDPGTFFTSRERNEAYFKHYERFVGKPAPLKASAITNFMWFENEALRSMLSMLESRHGRPWWQAAIATANEIETETAFSEYETYANWYAFEHGRPKEIPIDIFRRADLLLPDGTTGHAEVLSAIGRKGYDVATFELNHRRSWTRRLMMRGVLQLGLRAW